MKLIRAYERQVKALILLGYAGCAGFGFWVLVLHRAAAQGA